RVPHEAAAVIGMELVCQRRMYIGSDLFVEHPCPLAAEQQLSVGDGRAADAEGCAASSEPLLVLGGQRLVVEDRLAVPPALVVATEVAVIAVPGGDRALIELGDQIIADGPSSRLRIVRVVQPAKLMHGD